MAEYKAVEGDPDDLQPLALHEQLKRLAKVNPKPGYLEVMGEFGDAVRTIRSGKGHTIAIERRQALAEAIAIRVIPESF